MTLVFQIVMMVIGATLSVVLTKIFIQNGNFIRQNGESIRQNSELIRQNAELIKQNGEAIRQGLRQNAEASQKLLEKISNLIVTETEKTNKLVMELRK